MTAPSSTRADIDTAADDQLDTAILAALTACGGGPIEWSTVRAQLPAAPYWRKVAELVRLTERGAVDAVKVGGRTYVSPPLVRPAP